MSHELEGEETGFLRVTCFSQVLILEPSNATWKAGGHGLLEAIGVGWSRGPKAYPEPPKQKEFLHKLEESFGHVFLHIFFLWNCVLIILLELGDGFKYQY